MFLHGVNRKTRPLFAGVVLLIFTCSYFLSFCCAEKAALSNLVFKVATNHTVEINFGTPHSGDHSFAAFCLFVYSFTGVLFLSGLLNIASTPRKKIAVLPFLPCSTMINAP